MGQLPIGINNAHLNDQLVMRVGIPNSGGKLNFHAFNEGYPAMVSANAFWDGAKNEFRVPAASDLYELDFALDSAGFTAMQLWKSKGRQKGMAGIFPWSYSQYIELMTLLRPSWWSQPDLTCEPELVANQEEIDFRIDATATLLEGTLRILYAWSDELSKTCNAQTIQNMLPPPVPIVQGLRISFSINIP